MDYNNMTPDRLARSIFNASGYKINAADCKSRIENCCLKYANGDFEIHGKTHTHVKPKNQYNLINYAICIIIGTLIGLLF